MIAPVKAYNHDDATGFIRLYALRLKVAARVPGEKILILLFVRTIFVKKKVIKHKHGTPNPIPILLQEEEAMLAAVKKAVSSTPNPQSIRTG
jgi:hypothetical protein